jgi:uncharacterized damage-inducible protein DinB
MSDAFAHHTWATLRLLDTCAALNPAQLEAGAGGTYGSIIDTLRHTVAADSGYLHALTGGRVSGGGEGDIGVAEMRAVMERNGGEWQALLTGDLDPDTTIVRYRDDGSESHAPLGIRLAQALHHGTDHRSQVCTVLTTLGVEPPEIDVWDFGDGQGRLSEVPPTS